MPRVFFMRNMMKKTESRGGMRRECQDVLVMLDLSVMDDIVGSRES